MNEQKIKETFGRYFMEMGEENVGQALAKTMYDADIAALSSLGVVKGIDPASLSMLKLALDVKCSLCVETEIQLEGNTYLVVGGSLETFLRTYSKFHDLIQFLADNIDNFKYGKRMRKEMLEKHKKDLVPAVNSRYEQIKEDGGGLSNQKEIDGINYWCNLILQLILGEEAQGELSQKTKRIRTILEEIEEELVVKHPGQNHADQKFN